MYVTVLFAHSWLRWIILLLVALVVVFAAARRGLAVGFWIVISLMSSSFAQTARTRTKLLSRKSMPNSWPTPVDW